jgi:TonB-dependent SusC/RagA subfamily outer membrane receptor
MTGIRYLKVAFVFLTASWLFLGLADEDTRIARIREALWNFSVNYPQQKVYLHFDKSYYHTGDVIFFKAYLVDGMFHRPDSFSTNLYVELIDPSGTQADIIRVRMVNGFGSGDFNLSDTLPDGLYQIRAYTNWMLNFHPDYFFSRNFQVLNRGYKKMISPQQARKNLKMISHQNETYADLDVQFFPEGGDMVNDIESVVAFKAINKSGNGVIVRGRIYDEDKNPVAEIHTRYDGMGTFSMIPGKGKKYHAVIVSDDGKEYKFNLPEALLNGVCMRIHNQPGTISLTVSANKPPTNDRVANEVIIIGQVRGKVYYNNIVNIAEGPVSVDIKKNIFPTGIVQFTLFSGRVIPLAERLVFVNNSDFMRIGLQAYDTLTDRNERLICISLCTQDKYRKPLKSNVSLSVVYDPQEGSEMQENILSHFLLTSDLRGYIKNPGYYLRNAMMGNTEDINLLMLTHGWRKFDWTELLAKKLPEVKYYEERGITIGGQITTELLSIPLKNCKVELTVKEAYNDVFTQLSNEHGFFKFENLNYYDTMNVKIEAWRQNGKRNLIIAIPADPSPGVTKQFGEFSLTTQSERDNKAFRKERNRKEMLAYEEEKKRLAREDSSKLKGIYGEPDAVIRMKDIPDGYQNALQVIQGRVPGVNVVGDRVYIRGINTIFGSTDPLYLVDGMPVSDVNTVLSIPVEDIERIEILKGPSCAIYGSRGGNGVIAIYTKRGMFMKKGIIEFQMLGYHWPRKFYQPAFEPDIKPTEMKTINWFPVVETNENGTAVVVFKKPLPEGNLRIVVEGISYDGQAGYASVVLENN